MDAWPLQDAKNRLNAVVDAALAGTPQHLTRHGKPVVVVLAAAEYERMRRMDKASASSFADFLLAIPQDDGEFERIPLPLRPTVF